MTENSYGLLKRLEFVSGVIGSLRPRRVLDIGCGTGANLTQPLGARFPDVEFVAVDSDVGSIGFANDTNACPNVSFRTDTEGVGTFDLVIASEVIEHVEDPHAFLVALRTHLAPGGRMILTLPNGLGPFEWATFVETLLRLTGIHAVLLALKRRLRGRRGAVASTDTLAISPHINFFSYREIRSVMSRSGFEVLEYRPRTFLCGFGFDHLIVSERLVAWNARSADRLPPQLASAWMFVLAPRGEMHEPTYRRSAYALLRRYMNEKRWKLR